MAAGQLIWDLIKINLCLCVLVKLPSMKRSVSDSELVETMPGSLTLQQGEICQHSGFLLACAKILNIIPEHQPVWHHTGLEEAVSPDLWRRVLEGLFLISCVIFWLLVCHNPFKTNVHPAVCPHKVLEFLISLLYGLFLPAQCQGGWWRELVMTFKKAEWKACH